jgi:hypothetical protein
MKINKKLLCSLLCSQFLLSTGAYALEPSSVEYVYYKDRPLVCLNFYGAGKKLNDDYDSTYTLTAPLKQALMQGMDYMAQMLGTQAANKEPVNFYIFTNDVANADATTTNEAGEMCLDILQQAFVQGKALPPMTGAYIRIGVIDDKDEENKGWATDFSSQMPTGGNKFSLGPTIAHEMVHALGVLAAQDEDDSTRFASALNIYSEHLYDYYGKQAQPGMQIVDDTYTQNADLANSFIVRGFDDLSDEGGAYFSGEHVQEVLRGAELGDKYQVPGVPVNGWEYMGDDDEGNPVVLPDISHLELRNGLMSHFNYRNYTTFMEAELAVLQDLGYQIDRRNMFGFSVYNDGQTLINTQGYSARNAAGTAYLPGVANDSAFGVGLHIYGSNNTITQAADILTDGFAGTGIRIDGLGNNKITVAADTSVRADGFNGIGLLTAYGKNHELTVDGLVTALGSGGVAARFDFGDNLLANGTEYRGSYICSVGNANLKLSEENHPELSGALVKSFNVNGTLAGSAAAIYIARNAFVEKINIENGARFYGDIISEWGHFAEVEVPENLKIQYYDDGKLGTDLLTQLNFNADLAYNGKITGSDNLQLNVIGGKLLYDGSADVVSVKVASGAQLLGGSYKLNLQNSSNYDNSNSGQFISEGLIGAFTPTDGDTEMYIDGDLDAKNSKLQFTANKDFIGTITVTGKADITDTTLHIDKQGVYVPNKTYKTEIVKADGSLTGSITDMEEYRSGMLGAELNSTDTPKLLNALDNSGAVNITFMPQDNLGVRTAVQQQMYDNVSSVLASKPAYNYDYAELYSLDAVKAKAALTSLTGGVQSELATAVKQDRSAAAAVYDRLAAADTDSDKELWAVLQKGWGSMDSDGWRGESKTNSFGVTIGQDKALSELWRGGALLHYGRQNVSSSGDKGSADDVRLGFYSRYGRENAANVAMYLTYGWQTNETQRSLVNLPERLRGDYHSEVLSIGLQLSRTYPLSPPRVHDDSGWSIRPYAGADAFFYRLHGFSETGARGYRQSYDGQSDKVVSVDAGLEVKRKLGADGSYTIGAGYRHILTGEDTPLTARLTAGGSSFTSIGSGSAKDLLTFKLQGEAQVRENLTISGQLLQEMGQDTRRLTAALNAEWSF